MSNAKRYHSSLRELSRAKFESARRPNLVVKIAYLNM